MANKKQTTNVGNTGEQSTTGSGGTTRATDMAGRNLTPVSTTSGRSAGQPGSGQAGSTIGSTSAGTGSTGSTSGGTGTGTAVARSFYDQAKETAGHAYEVAAEKATTKLDEQKTTLSDGLTSIAHSVRAVGENLRGPEVQEGLSKYTAEYSGKAAEKIEGVANYFEQKSVREMYSDLESFARRNPLAFIGGAFALGMLAARFLKSGGPDRMSARGAAFAGEGMDTVGSRSGFEGNSVNR